MKKSTFATLLLASVVSTSLYALPTYEPFTEFSSLVLANPTNAIDLATGGYTAPSGESWVSINYSALGEGPGEIKGIDILVTNWGSSVFSSNNLYKLLPTTFPGFPGYNQTITVVADNVAPLTTGTPAQTVGNSAELMFSSDITRPTGTNKTLYISYLISVAQKGQLGAGNDGRYLDFLCETNTVLPSSAYPYWTNMFSFSGNAALNETNQTYVSHALLDDGTANQANTNAFIGACDSSSGKELTTSPFVISMGTNTTQGAPAFIVGEYTFNGSGGADTNTLWMNPSISSFGGSASPAGGQSNTMHFNMADIASLVLEDRVGSGAAGGMGTNYIYNVLIGSTWSYVTGGPEFGTGPGNVTAPMGGNATISAVVFAANQGVGTVWQKVTPTTTNTVTAGAGGAGGAATVSFTTNGNANAGYTVAMVLTGISSGDLGSYQVVGTSSGTGYSLTSSVGTLSIQDPSFTSQPTSVSNIYGATISFSANVATSTGQISYAWYNGSTMLANGTLPDGTHATGAAGTISANTATITLQLAGISYQDAGTYTLQITNLSGGTAASTPVTLIVTDPYVVTQPPPIVEIAQGGSGTIPISVIGSGVNYAWNWVNGEGSDGNSGEISGTSTSALQISPASVADQGTYSVAVGGASGQVPATTSTVVYVDSAPTSVAIAPNQLTQSVGTHLAIVGTTTGGSGIFNYIWKKNGSIITSGVQGDGSFYFGAGAKLIGANIGFLIVSNAQVGDSGTYTLISSNAAGMVTSGPVVITITTNLLRLQSTNLIVSRVGEGSQTLSGATGNTLYLDQYTSNGTYVNTIMVPDQQSAGALIEPGGGGDWQNESYITLSSNQEYINLTGYFESYPFGGLDVTTGGAAYPRTIGAVSVFGLYTMAYTNQGLYNGGNHWIRDAYSSDGLQNFWTTGSAGSGGGVKYVNSTVASYATGNGIPVLSQSLIGPTCLGLIGTNLVYSDFNTSTASDTNAYPGEPFPPVTSGSQDFGPYYQAYFGYYGQVTYGPPYPANGLDIFSNGLPALAASAWITNQTNFVYDGAPADFIASPDMQTIYMADSTNALSAPYGAGQSFGGGIDRFDWVPSANNGNGAYGYAYTLQDTTAVNGTNGLRGLTAYFPPGSTGPGGIGAYVYATSSEQTTNRLIQFIDNGQSSTPTLLATAGFNQSFRGVRFGPSYFAPSVTVSPSSLNAVSGQEVDLLGSVTGSGPFTYQWTSNGTSIAGATTTLLVVTNIQMGATYALSATNPIGATASASSVVSIVSFTGMNNLVGWWKLSDGTGTNAADSSGYGDTGAIWISNSPGGAPDWVNGLGSTYALDLTNYDTNWPSADTNNNDNVVLIPDAPQLNFTNNLAFTLATWVQPGTNAQVSGAALIAKGYGGADEQYTIDVVNNNPNVYRFYVRNAAGTSVTLVETNYIPNTNGWDHVAVTYDGYSETMAMYINGQLQTNIGAAAGVPNTLLPNSWPVSLGNRTSGATTTYDFPLVGTMQDVRIYNVALGQSDIQTIYNLLAPPGILVYSNSAALVVDNQATPVSFGSNTVGNFTPITFEVTNPGPVALTLGTVTASAGFTIVSQPPSTIAAGSSGTFSVNLTYSGSVPYTNSGTVSIPNNVPLFSPFTFPVTGIIGAPVAPTPVVWASLPVTGAPSAPVLHFSGTLGATYHVWSTTNIQLQPIETTWTPLGTGSFSGGNDTFNAPAGSPNSATFYAITQP